MYGGLVALNVSVEKRGYLFVHSGRTAIASRRTEGREFGDAHTLPGLVTLYGRKTAT